MSDLDKFNYECPGQISIFDLMTPAERYYFNTGRTDYWGQEKAFGDNNNPIPICRHSKHKCNKEVLFEVASTLDDIECPRVCCRNCHYISCGARCNGTEKGK